MTYRVSFFVPDDPGKTTKWTRIAASHGNQAMSAWKHPTAADDRVSCGLVAFTGAERRNEYVLGVPDEGGARQSALVLADYRARTRVSESEWKNRTWKFATMRTFYVRSESGESLGVFVVEREDGRSIEFRGVEVSEPDGHALDQEMQVAAGVWASALEVG